jgi:hypothetical protein
MHCRFFGRFEEARIEQEMFERQNRTDVTARYHTMAARYVEGRYAEGIQEARKTLQMYPGHHIGFISLAYCAVEKPDYPLAIEATRQGRAVEDKQEPQVPGTAQAGRLGRLAAVAAMNPLRLARTFLSARWRDSLGLRLLRATLGKCRVRISRSVWSAPARALIVA